MCFPLMDGNVRIGCPSGNSSEATVIICGHTCPGACIIVNVLFLLGQTNNNCGQGQISKKEFTLCFFPTDQKSPGTPQRSLTTKSQNKARWYQTSHFGAVCDEADYASWQAQLLPASPEQAKVSLYHSHDRPASTLFGFLLVVFFNLQSECQVYFFSNLHLGLYFVAASVYAGCFHYWLVLYISKFPLSF